MIMPDKFNTTDHDAEKLWQWADEHDIPTLSPCGIERQLDLLATQTRLLLSKLGLNYIP